MCSTGNIEMEGGRDGEGLWRHSEPERRRRRLGSASRMGNT